MKKNFLFGTLAVLLAGFWFGGASLADNIAQIGTTQYSSLRDAIESAIDGDEITLLADDNVSFSASNLELAIDKRVVINGNGHTLYGVENYVAADEVPVRHAIFISGSQNITIENITLSKFGYGNYLSQQVYPIWVKASYGAKLILSGVTITDYNRSAINVNGGSVEIENCNIIGNKKEDGRGRYFQGGIELMAINSTASLTIDNTTIDGIESNVYEAAAVQSSLHGNLTINGGTFKGVGDNGYSLIVANFDYTSAGYGTTDTTLTVNGGNFDGKLLKEEGNGKLIISGGKFSVNPETSGYVDTGYYAKDNGDGTWTVEAQTEISTIEITGVVDPVAGAEPFTGFTVTTGVVLNSTWTGEDDAAFDSFVAGSGYTLTIEISADTGYILSGNYTVTLNGESVTQTANKVSKTYKGKFKVTFDGENETLVESGDTVSAPTVSKECNTLDGWYNGDEKFDFGSGVTSNLALTSKWTYSCSRSSGGGGGSSRTTTTSKDDTKANTGDTAKTDEQKVDENKMEEETVNEENKVEEKAPMTDAEAVSKFGQEQIDAYKWALENGITTMKTVEEARLDQPLTRAELAKMMVVYIAKILEKQPVVTGSATYDDVDNSLGDLAGYIQLAYQYQIMGINADGTPIDFFNPNGIVTRGEYATVFSRVLFGSLFNKEGEDFYTNHLKALEAAGILSNTEPTIQEMRGWVMLMMYRSSKNTDKIAEVISTLGASEQEAADAQAKAEEEKVAEAPEAEATTGDIVEAPEAEAITGDVAEVPEAEATTGDVASN